MKLKLSFFFFLPIAIYTFTNLPSFKIAQVEKTFYYDEKIYLPGRVLRLDDNNIKISDTNDLILIVTPSGFVISVERKYVTTEPKGKIDAVLKEQEFVLKSQNILPYDGKLEKVDDNNWFIPNKI